MIENREHEIVQLAVLILPLNFAYEAGRDLWTKGVEFEQPIPAVLQAIRDFFVGALRFFDQLLQLQLRRFLACRKSLRQVIHSCAEPLQQFATALRSEEHTSE